MEILIGLAVFAGLIMLGFLFHAARAKDPVEPRLPDNSPDDASHFPPPMPPV